MPLLERLARRLEISSERAENLLLRILDERREELERQGHVDFPGVGRFLRTDEGVSFEPDGRLSELIDVRHAGSEPIPLFTGEELPEDGDEEEAPDEPDDEAAAGAVPGEREREPRPETAADEDAASGAEDRARTPAEEVEEPSEPVWETREDHPLGDLPEESYQETSYEVMEEAETEREAEVEETGAEEERAEARASDEEPSSSSSSETESGGSERSRRRSGSRRASSSDRRREDSRRTLAIVAGLLIVTGSALILYFLWSPGDGTSSAVGGEGSAADTARTARTAPADSAQTGSPPESAATLPLEAPLRSSGTVDPGLGGSTWIVGSFSDSSRAASVQQSYRDDGYRAAVLPGGSGYRVAVGQFESESAAEATRGALPADISDQAWTLEFDAQQ